MADFYHFTTEQQAEELRQAALGALPAYGLEGARVELIKHEMNTVFQVTDGEGRRYVLRVPPDFWLDEAAIASELVFLQALAQDGCVQASKPVRALDGSFVRKIEREGVPGPRCAVLFEGLPGEMPSEGLSAETLVQSGRQLALLHEFGRSFAPPKGFKRPCMDFDGLFDPQTGIYAMRGGDYIFTRAQKDVLAQAGDKLRARLGQIGYGQDDFGFIHGDYYYRNIIVGGKGIGVIDFDLCGYAATCLTWWCLIGPKIRAIWTRSTAFPCGLRLRAPGPRGFDEYKSDMLACRR
jgi:Ser/Thr protein kinase RdoA (MazF antagonist)